MSDAAEQMPLSLHIYRLLDEGRGREQIIEELLGNGHDETFVRALVHETSKLRYARKRVQGLALILGGAVICLASCILTLISTSAGNLSTVLFGLTSIGIIIVFAGLVKVF